MSDAGVFGVTCRWWALALLAGTAACAPTAQIKTLVLPEWHEAARLRRIAVQPFAGERGPETTALVTEALARARLADVPCFEVVPFTPSPQARAAGPAEAGRELGVDAVWAASVTTAEAVWEEWTEKECKDKEPPAFGVACKESVEVHCRRRAGYFAVQAQLHAVATGQIVRSGAIRGQRSDDTKDCEESGFGSWVHGILPGMLDRALGNDSFFIGRAQEDVVANLVANVTPRYDTVEVPLLEPGDSVPKPVREKVVAALGALRGGTMDAFCAAISDARPHADADPPLAYDLAVCAEHGGRLGEAWALYARAVERDTKENDLYLKALHRVDRASLGTAYLQGATPVTPQAAP
jgi:hypothetical protein